MPVQLSIPEKELLKHYHIWILVIGKLVSSIRRNLRDSEVYDLYIDYGVTMTSFTEISTVLNKYQHSDKYQSKIITINSNVDITIRKYLDTFEPKPVDEELITFFKANLADLLCIELKACIYKAFYKTNLHAIYSHMQTVSKNMSALCDRIETDYCKYRECSWTDVSLNNIVRTVIDDCFHAVVKELENEGQNILYGSIRSSHGKIYSKDELMKILIDRIGPITETMITNNPITTTGPLPV